MKISVICKLSDGMAYDFLRPLIDIDEISHISVFRDHPSKNNSKLKYINSQESQLFKKSNILFGLKQNLEFIRAKKEI